AVSARDCSTLATLSRRDKTHIQYSPDGNRVLFERNGGLIGARYDGASSQWVARSRYRPRNARWSPDGSRIAFEVQSEQYGNITHLAIYEYATGRMTIHSDEKPLGVPRDMNPCWSPNGDRIAHDRDYFRSGGGQEYVQRQRVASAMDGGTEVVVAEELVRDVSPAEPGPCGWIDDNHLVVTSTEGPRVFNIETKVAYRLPENSRLLWARVVSRE
ncbi:MAG: PD40 domain-containing protein, partial [Gemmatimonadetes bacterium]|nr:PD40 domain-containing protein [Gemmatimonadota bacterium]